MYRLYASLLFAAAFCAPTLPARAAGPLESTAARQPKAERDSTYEVRPGDTLRAIALELGYEMDDLMKANGLDNANRIFAGQTIHLPVDPKNGRVTPAGVVLNIPPGFNLTRLAAAYGISRKALIRANNLTNPNKVRVGQKILIPGAKYVVVLVPPPPCFKDPVTLFRVHTEETKVVPLCFCNGKPNPEGVDALSSLSGPLGKEVPFSLHPRLAVLLQAIAEKFPGKRFEIISGQRLPRQTGQESYHNKGQALDFRLEGVSNRALVTFARTFENVGVGFYPNSVFIHLDTREQDAYWVDYSRPGEKAIYARAGLSREEIDKIREHRALRTSVALAEQARNSIKNLIASFRQKFTD